MTALYVIGGIALFLALLGAIPLMPEVVWDDGLTVIFRIGPVPLRFGGKKDGAAGADKEPAKKDQNAAPKEKKRPSLATVCLLVRHGFDALCRLVSRFRVDTLCVRFTAGAPDPADAAMEYAAAGAALDVLANLGEGHVRHEELWAGVDFDAGSPAVYLRLRLSIRVYQVIGALARFGIGYLRDSRQIKKEEQ